MGRILEIVRAAICVLCFIFVIIGVTGQLYTVTFMGQKVAGYFYKETAKINGVTYTTNYGTSRPSGMCEARWHRNRAAYTFAILACLSSAFASLSSILGIFFKQIKDIISVGLIVLTFFFLLISWPIATSLWSSTVCDTNLNNDGAKLGYGTVFLILAWILTIPAAVLFYFPRKN